MPSAKNGEREFGRVPLSDLRQGRRGKHHETVMPIVEQIRALPDGEALIIPMAELKIPFAKLRSALVKAAATRELKVATYSDGNTLYVWRRTGKSRPFERAPKRAGKPKKS